MPFPNSSLCAEIAPPCIYDDRFTERETKFQASFAFLLLLSLAISGPARLMTGPRGNCATFGISRLFLGPLVTEAESSPFRDGRHHVFAVHSN